MDNLPTTTFAGIRRGFDPSLSYLIVVNTSAYGQPADFDCIHKRLAGLQAGIVNTALYREVETGRLLLVLTLTPALAVFIQQHLTGSRLPVQLAAYFYGS